MKKIIAYSYVAVFSMCSILGGNALATDGAHDHDNNAEEFEILRHEPIDFYQTSSAPSEDENGNSRAALKTGSFNLSFDAYGQQFNLTL